MRNWKAVPILMSAVGVFCSCAPAVLADDPKKDEPLPGVIQDYDVPPKPVQVTRPEYPPAAFEQGVEGTVLLELLINAKGKVVRVKVLKSIPELDDAAVRCVKKWRFKPAEKDGRPVATIAQAPVAFRRDAPKQTES